MDCHQQEGVQHTFAFIFPLASGHLNPSLPVARTLVRRGHKVHYLAFEQMREAIEDTGAVWHSALEHMTELFRDPQVGFMETFGALLGEFGLDMKGSNFWGIRNIALERKMPGTVRFLRGLRPTGVVYCPLMCVEAMVAAKVLGIPSASLNTIAGPGSCLTAMEAMLEQDKVDKDDFRHFVNSFEPDAAAVRRLNEEYGLGLEAGLLEPWGKFDGFQFASVNLVTTSEDLQDPIPPELARSYEADGCSFSFVGPLLDEAGALRSAGHRDHAASAPPQSPPQPESQSAGADEVLDRVRAARAAGRKVVLASMGTVITGDMPTMGWEGRALDPDGLPHGLSGRELCQAAWAGLFGAFGAASEGEGPLLVVSLGPQTSPLGDLAAPPNAVCVPVVPQVDVLKAGVDLFLTHGGQNSFTEALAHGTPVVVCPGFGDQIVNAQKAVDLGVGLKADRPFPPAGGEKEAAERFAEEVGQKLLEVWQSPAHAAAAVACADRLRRAGGVPRAAELLLEMVGKPKTPQVPAASAQAAAHIGGA